VAVSTTKARLALAPPSATLGVVAVFVIALAGAAALHHEASLPAHVSREQAVRAALADSSVRKYLAAHPFTRERVTPVDNKLARVSFFDGPRIVLEAAVAGDGRVVSQIVHKPGDVRVGGEIAQRPAVLALLLAAFALAAASVPFRRMRNLDVLALAAFAVPVVLMNARLLEASVYTSYPLLAYLCIRCGLVALRPQAAEARAQPLIERIVRPRLIAVGAAAAAAALVLLAIPGGLVGDVAFASMAGATKLTHGTLPYGHLPANELVHGDTYPLLAYAAYVPAALITPVKTGFDQLDGALWVAAGFALAAAFALYRVGGRRLAIAWLTFPPVVIAASAGANDLVAAACIAWAAALFLHSGRSAAALSAAALVKLAPFAALPLWVLRARGNGLARAVAGVGAVAGAVALWIVLLDGAGGLRDMADAVSFQAERGSLQSLWALTGAGAAQVAVQAAVATLAVAGAAQVWRDPLLAVDRRRVCALAAAVLLGAQMAANYWSYTYLCWAFPVIAAALLAESGAKPAPSRAPAFPAPRP
jgi:hypothetical protein